MRIEVAKNRITEVLRADTMTTSNSDFFATHVPLQNIEIYTKFDPNDAKKSVKYRSKDVSEDYIFKNFILNPEDRHQFILVMGESGAGKSHLIRWYNACMKNCVRDSEIVLFIRRNDNTLKGTIKQLLQHDEIKNLNNKELYERLLKATAVISENMLKNEIISKFRIQIQDNLDTDDDDEEQLTYTDKKRLVAFLKFNKIEEKFKEINGPIDRIYSKIAQSDKVMNDINAMFDVKDFNIDDDENIELLSDIMTLADNDTKALANKIKDNYDYKLKIVKYLNSFLDKVVQSCSGLQAGDFEEIFMEIRRNLKKQGKALTILIEDITSFTGVNIELLNALTTEHTGHGNQDLCRISSVIGITSGYFKDHFKANYRDRTTLFVYLKNNIFSDEYLYEFVGKYLNTMSMTNDEIDIWIKNGALSEQYPIHKASEGKNWDYYEMKDVKQLSLYPFTKSAIINLYNYRLELKTPRYILQYIIEPIVRDIILDQVSFPNVKELMNYNGNPSSLLRSKIFDSQAINKNDKERMFLFMCLWGNGTDKIEIRNDKKYISGIAEEVYKELNLPILDNLQIIKTIGTSSPALEVGAANVVKEPQVTTKPVNYETVKNNNKIQKVIALLEEWIGGGTINVGTTAGNEAILSRARDNIIKYIQSAINWQIEGVTLDNLKKVIDSRYSLIGFERQVKGYYLVELKANRQTQKILEAFVRWDIEGNNSWNFKDGDYYALAVEIWTEKVKNSIIEALNYSKGKDVNYQKFATALEMCRQLISGQINGKWNYYKSSSFFENNICDIDMSSEHSREWISLQEQIKRLFDPSDNPRKVSLQYYNIIQGKGGQKIYIDRIKFDKDFAEIKKRQLSLDDMFYQDEIKTRGEFEEQFNNISSKLNTVYEAEIKKISEESAYIYQILGCSVLNAEEISELLVNAQLFYDEVSNAKLYCAYPEFNLIKRNKNKISEALSIINEILSNNDKFDNFILMSHDPLKTISSFVKFVKKLKDDMERVDNQIKEKQDKILAETGQFIRDPYQDENDAIEECNIIMGKLR